MLMNMSSRMTLCNMAVEAGATSGVCSPDLVTAQYLWPFIKDEYQSPEQAAEAFSRWHSDEDAHYERVLTLDVSTLAPQVRYGQVSQTDASKAGLASCVARSAAVTS